MSTTDVVIIGGGVIGCSIAYFLRTSGINVVVLEQTALGAQASSAAAGLLAPLGPLSGPGAFADLMLASFALFPSLVPELEALSGLHVGYEQTGALRIVRNPKRIANLAKRMREWQPLGLTMQWMTGEEARAMEPSLTEDVCAAIYAPEESQINAPQLVQAFAKAATHIGALFFPDTVAIGIEREHISVTAVHTSTGETIACKHLILATGAWSARYETWFSLTLPVSPQRGQIVTFPQHSPPLRHIIFGDAIYIAPKGNTILVGATKEDAGFEVRVTDEGTSWLHDSAGKLIPALAHSEIQASWASLRPKTLDTRPILGNAPGWKNVTLAVGHNSVGILLSAITGKAIAELVTTGTTPEILRAFALERFSA